MLTLVALLTLPAFQPINHVPLPPEGNVFDFAVLGDNRPAGAGQPPTPVFAEIIREVGYIHPSFVLSSGDLVYGNEESIEAYRKECDGISAILKGLSVPFFNAPGNHEIADREDLQAEYVKRFGPLYGSFEYGGCRFVALCTDEAKSKGALSDTQMDWLKGTLSPNKPTFVYLHRPLFARDGNDEEGATVAQAAALHELFKSKNVRAVFEGHDHVYNHQKHDGIDYTISGGAGAPLDTSPDKGGFFHFVLVHVEDGKATFSVIPYNAIQVVNESGKVRVSSYCDDDLELGDFTTSVKSKPTTATAVMDNKGKLSDVPVVITKADKTADGYTVHLKFKLKKHRQTIIELK